MKRVGAGLAVTAFLIFSSVVSAQSSVAWSRQIGTGANDRAFDVTDGGSGLFIGGATFGSLYATNAGVNTSSDAFVTLFNSNGTTAWGAQFGSSINGTPTSEYVSNVAAAGLDYYALGQTGGTLGVSNLGGSDIFLRKYNSAGAPSWTQQFGTLQHDQPDGLDVSLGGSTIYVSGRFDSTGSTQDAFVAQYNASGTQLWQRRFGTATSDYASAVKADPAGGAVVVGSTAGDLAGSVGGFDAFVRKYDAAGNVVWTKQFGSTQADNVKSVAVDGNGDIFVTGDTAGVIGGITPAGYDDRQGFVAKLSSTGALAWVRQIDTSDEDAALDIAVDHNGAITIAGQAYRSIDGYNYLLARLDPNGNTEWAQVIATNAVDEGFTSILMSNFATQAYLSGYTTGSYNGAMPAGNEDAIVTILNVIPEPASAWLVAGALLLSGRRRVRSPRRC